MTQREQITSVALQAFLEAPYSRISIREIAARSNVSHTYVHTLFGGKLDLFRAVIKLAADRMRQAANILDEDGEATAGLKLLTTDPLNQPLVQLLRKSVGDPDMWGVLTEALDGDLAIADIHRLISGRKLTIPPISGEAWAVFALLLVWSPCAVDLLLTSGNTTPEEEARLLGAPQELMLAFYSMLQTQT